MRISNGAMVAAVVAGLLAAQPGASAPRPRAAGPLRLERVVMLMRHGIRPPTKAQPIPAGYTSDRWPAWSVGPGELTARGAAGVGLLGASDRAWLQTRGLIGPGCPAAGTVVVKASNKQRAIRTAETWSARFLPGCGVTVDHPGEGGADPLFHGLDDQPASFDGARALREAQALLPAGGVAAEARAHAGEVALLARVLNCTTPNCPLLKEESRLVGSAHDRPELEGPIDLGSTVSQTLLLEYLEGMPMTDVGWGRVSRAEIERLLRFHPLKFRYSNRPDYVARVAAAPLAQAMLGALRGTAKVTLLAGHDTNLADMAGFLQTHWQAASYPMDDVPPGGALGLELLRDSSGHRYVRAFFRAQTMDQLRNQTTLVGRDAVKPQYLAIPGCGNSTAARACTLARFESFVGARTRL